MKIIVLGASGRVGQEIVKLALKDNHEVTAFVRNTDSFQVANHSGLSLFQGDALNPRDISQSFAGQDMVISALASAGNQVLSRSIPLMKKAMGEAGISRIITVGTAGILQSRHEPELFRFQSSESRNRRTTAAEDHLQVYESLKDSPLNWTIFCPTYLPDGEATGTVRYELDYLPEGGKRITVGDTALFLYKQKDNPVFFKKRVGLAE